MATHYRRLLVWVSLVVMLVVVGALFSKLYYDLTLEGSNPFQLASPVRMGGVMRLQTLEARVVPAQQVDLAFSVAGRLSATLVEPGQKVVKGQVLARLDDSRSQLTVARARENLRVAELGELRSQIEQAKLELAAAQLELETSVLKAPFDGQVLAVPAVAGQAVTPNTLIATLAQVEPLMVHTLIAQNALRHITPGLVTHVTLEAFPGRIWEGHVVQIGSQAVQTPRGVGVGILIELDGAEDRNPGGTAEEAFQVVPGLTAKAEILIPRKHGTMDVANWFIAVLFMLMLVMTYVISVIMTPKVEDVPDDGMGGRGGRMSGMGWGGHGFGRH